MTVFKSIEPGDVTVVTPRGQFFVPRGGEVESDDPEVIAAFEANPSLEEKAAKSSKKKKDD